MESKIQIVLGVEGAEDWHYYVVQEDGEFLDKGGPYDSEEDARAAASAQHPDLEFVQSVPQEIWPPQA